MKSKFLLGIFCLLSLSCKKDWLDAKPSNSLIVPSTLEDFRALLDNTSIMNQNQAGSLGEISAGDFTNSYTAFLTAVASERNAYLWASNVDFYDGQTDPNWRNSYQRILCANLVLEGVGKINDGGAGATALKGAALFYRSYDFFALAQQYCQPYGPSTQTAPGIPLKLSSDPGSQSTRSTIAETYQQIINDLTIAKDILPITESFKTRPTRAAALGMLARVHLAMGNYPEALNFASRCLDIQNTLIDYSTLSLTSNTPIVRFNTEVIYQARLGNATPFIASTFNASSELLALYENNDLRGKIFFRTSGNNILFKGSYDGSSTFFSGLAVDEILLIRAECYARANMLTESLKDLNDLLRKRWSKAPAYVDLVFSDSKLLLRKILTERRKELCFRGIRWTDLRRLNVDPEYATTLKRTLNGVDYVLEPNSPKYVFPMDNNEILYSGIEQNLR